MKSIPLFLGRDAALSRGFGTPRPAAQPVWSDVVPRTFRPLCASGDGATHRPYHFVVAYPLLNFRK